MRIIIILVMMFSGASLLLAPSFSRADSLDVFENEIISAGSVVGTVNIKNSLYLENRGQILSEINVSDGCDLYLENSGAIFGNINLGNNATIVQIIKNSNDITSIPVYSDYSILVQSNGPLKLSDIQNIAGGANKIVIDNSTLFLGKKQKSPMLLFLRAQPLPARIELIGEIWVEIEDVNDLVDGLLLSNVTGDGVINIRVLNPDFVNTFTVVRRDGNIYLNIDRDLYYQRIINDSYGNFLDKFRDKKPNHPTIISMDRAKTKKELNKVMEKSSVFNPMILMDPVKIFNDFESNDFYTKQESESFDITSSAIYIFSNSLDLTGGKISMNFSKPSFGFTLSGYAGNFEISDEINEYSGDFYGGKVRANFNIKSLWMDLGVGFTTSVYNDNMVFYKNIESDNQTGNSKYGFYNAGFKFEFDEIYILPFIGGGAGVYEILGDKNESFYANAGGRFGHSKETNGLRYDYEFFASSQINGNINAGVKFNFFSIIDLAGGGFSYSVLNSDFGFLQKLSAELKIVF